MDSHASEARHAGAGITPYLVIFGALVIFTGISFGANYMVHLGSMQKGTSFVIILGVAVVKAVLVAMFFMHLKLDWPKLYFMIIPVLILGVMMVIVLLPDIVLAWHH
jgi:caa(3)-type oxidase subunit IV